MYRVFLLITLFAYCSSAPSAGSNARKPVIIEQNDDTDLIDSSGGGYSFFRKQQIDVRPSAKAPLDIPFQDLAAYLYGSAFKGGSFPKQPLPPASHPTLNNAFGQQQLMPRPNLPVQNLLPPTTQIQPPAFRQNDLAQLPSTIRGKYTSQQGNLPFQSQLSGMNTFANQQQQQQQDQRGVGSLQFLLPQHNLNLPQLTINNFGNQQPQTWSNQQQSTGFSSSYGSQGQQPVSSSFLIQSNQQNDQPSITDALFMSSQRPTQRFISSKQPSLSNNGW